MQVDVARLVPAVTRTVKRYTKDGKPHVSVVLSRVYDTSADDLWDALTNAERLPRWFAPVTGELRLGGRYQVQGNAGGTVTACEPPKHFAATWEFGGAVSWIDVRVTADAGGSSGKERARLTLDHIAVDDGNPHWDRFGPGAVGIGWDLGLLGMHNYLSAGAPGKKVDPAEAMAWMSSDNAKAFMRASGAGWEKADVAGGQDAAAAKRRSDATIAFYCGEPDPNTRHPGQV